MTGSTAQCSLPHLARRVSWYDPVYTHNMLCSRGWIVNANKLQRVFLAARPRLAAPDGDKDIGSEDNDEETFPFAATGVTP